METINHEYYVSLEVAKLLKEAGFDWEYNRYYEFDGKLVWTYFENWNDVMWSRHSTAIYSAPSLEVAQRWLREVKGIHMCVKADAASINCKYFVTVIISDTKWGNVQDENMKTILFSTYEEAQEAGVQKCLTILLNESK